MVACRPQLAVGDKRCGSIDHLLRHDGAMVASSKQDLEFVLQRIIEEDTYLDEYARKGWDCGKKLHNRSDLQAMMKADFKALLEE